MENMCLWLKAGQLCSLWNKIHESKPMQPELGVEKSCFAECKAQFKPGNFSQKAGHSGPCQGIKICQLSNLLKAL